MIDCARLVWVMGFVFRFAHNLKTFLSRYEVTKRDLLFEEYQNSCIFFT